MRDVRGIVGGHGLRGRAMKKSGWSVSWLDNLRAFDINAGQWTTAAEDEGE